jgi:hypothetical protein
MPAPPLSGDVSSLPDELLPLPNCVPWLASYPDEPELASFDALLLLEEEPEDAQPAGASRPAAKHAATRPECGKDGARVRRNIFRMHARSTRNPSIFKTLKRLWRTRVDGVRGSSF